MLTSQDTLTDRVYRRVIDIMDEPEIMASHDENEIAFRYVMAERRHRRQETLGKDARLGLAASPQDLS